MIFQPETERFWKTEWVSAAVWKGVHKANSEQDSQEIYSNSLFINIHCDIFIYIYIYSLTFSWSPLSPRPLLPFFKYRSCYTKLLTSRRWVSGGKGFVFGFPHVSTEALQLAHPKLEFRVGDQLGEFLHNTGGSKTGRSTADWSLAFSGTDFRGSGSCIAEGERSQNHSCVWWTWTELSKTSATKSVLLLFTQPLELASSLLAYSTKSRQI